MKYKLSDSVFWPIATRSDIDDDLELTAKQEKQSSVIMKKLADIENQKIELLKELKTLHNNELYYVGDQASSLCGYHSSKQWLLFENFTDDELAELNADGILSEAQHQCVTTNENAHQLPLHADRLMSRRELQKAAKWSNDKFNRLSDERDNFPVLIEGNAKHTYSAFQVYRWALMFKRVHREHDLFSDWRDATEFGDFERNRGAVLSQYKYREIMPELFDKAAA